MSENEQTTESGAQINGEPQTEAPEGIGTGDPQNDSQGEYKPPREKRYREERNAARAMVEALQVRELERLAGEHLAQPSDLLELGGVTLGDMLGEDGYVNPETVADAVAALIEARPGLAKNPRQRAVDPSQGSGSGRPGKGKLDWADLFRS